MDDSFLTQILQEVREEESRWARIVCVGDYVLCERTQRYTFSRHRYTRKGKLYQVREVDPRGYVIVFGDYTEPGPNYREKVWLSVSLTIRNGIPVFVPSYFRPKDVSKAIKQYNKRFLRRAKNESV